MRRCIGYGIFEGKCDKFITHPEYGTYWCDSCNKIRIATITKQFNTIKENFNKETENENVL